MKKLIVLALLILPFSIWSQTKGKITYLVSIDKTEIEAPYENPNNTEEKNEALSLLEEAQPVEAYLVFNDSVALYYVQEEDEIPKWENSDGIININPSGINFTWFMAGSSNLYYTDWSRDFNISTFDNMGSKKRVIRKTYEWIITEETKTIKNYLCYKAILNKDEKRFAWFTKSIPANHGPKGFNNLPGLVLEFYNNKHSFVATSIELNNKEADDIIEPKEGELIQYEELMKYGKAIFGDN